MRKNIRQAILIAFFIGFLGIVISCEEDFTDIGSRVITNTKFDTDAIFIDITAVNSPIEKIQTDNISRQLGQYLLGVYSNPNYEKLEASIISQVLINNNLKIIVEKDLGKDKKLADFDVKTTIDTVFLKIPYQVRLASSGKSYELDSVFGDASKAFTLNVFRSNTFLNTFSPLDPSKINQFFSNDVFEKTGSELNTESNFQFKPSNADTLLVIKRRSSENVLFRTDSIKLEVSSTNKVPVPFARIPLKEDAIKSIFLDKYESVELASQDAFNDYFRGIILEASGNEGSLLSLNFNNTVASLRPTLEVYYTNTLFKKGTTIIDTILPKNDSFTMNGFKINTYKMEDKVYPTNNEIKIQGTAGSESIIDLFGPDTDNNGVADKIEELRAKKILINDATLTFFINQNADTSFVPERLYLYKSDSSSGIEVASQLKDAISEASFGGISGGLVKDANGKKEKYNFKITDYVSDLILGNTNYSPSLKLKVYNTSDNPTAGNDTIFRNFSWNPKAVTLLNQDSSNGNKKAVLKISFSERK